jgi:hypothetical protein
MRKSLIVVEGQTEQIFVQTFIEELVATQPCHIELTKLHGGLEIKLSPRGVPIDNCTHHIRIVNASNDEKVNSFIADNLESFKSKGFELVCGLRDSFTGNKLKPKINIDGLNKKFEALAQHFGIPVEVIVIVEEIEAWFLAVPDFFEKYDKSLTIERVNKIIGFNLSETPVENIEHPSALINRVLQTVGLAYKKKIGDCYKIANLLDYGALFLEKIDHIPSLNRFVGVLNNCLAPCVLSE